MIFAFFNDYKTITHFNINFDILPMPKGRGFFLSECLSYIGYEVYTLYLWGMT